MFSLLNFCHVLGKNCDLFKIFLKSLLRIILFVFLIATCMSLSLHCLYSYFSFRLSYLLTYWVGQKVHLGFSITSYGKKAIKLFGQPYWMLRKSTVLTPRGVWLAWASTRGRRGNTPGQGRNWVLFEASIEVSVPVYCSSARLLQRVSRLDSPCWQAGSAQWGLADGDHVAGLRFPPLRDMCSQHPSATASGARHQQEGPTIALLTRSLTLY